LKQTGRYPGPVRKKTQGRENDTPKRGRKKKKNEKRTTKGVPGESPSSPTGRGRIRRMGIKEKKLKKSVRMEGATMPHCTRSNRNGVGEENWNSNRPLQRAVVEN